MGCGGCRMGNTVKVIVKPTDDPTMHPDGKMEFPNKAPTVEGYKVHPKNDKILIPDGVNCQHRITGIMLQKDGSYRPYHVCKHSQCEHRHNEVTYSICEACPLRQGQTMNEI